MCLLAFKASADVLNKEIKTEETPVEEKPKEEESDMIEEHIQSDGTRVFFDTRTGRYYVPEKPVVTLQPAAIAAPEPVLQLVKAAPVLLPTIVDQTTILPMKPKYYIPKANTLQKLGIKQPKGKGYDTPELAVSEAIKAGLPLETGWKVHVMRGKLGGWFVVGLSQ